MKHTADDILKTSLDINIQINPVYKPRAEENKKMLTVRVFDRYG